MDHEMTINSNTTTSTTTPHDLVYFVWKLLTGFVRECSNQNQTSPEAKVFLSKLTGNDENLPTFYLLALIFGSVLCLTTLALGVMHTLYIIVYVTHPYRRVFVLYLAGTAPFVSSFALVSMFMPRIWFLAHLFSFFYFSIGLYFVICLLMHIVEGRSSMVKKMTQKSCDIRISTPPFCCFLGPCLPTLNVESRKIKILEWMVMQNPCIRLFATIVSLVLYFEYMDKAFVYLKVLDFIFLPSLLCGIYGCHILVTTVSKLDELIPYRYIVVFRLLDIYFMFFGLQQPIFDFLARAGVFGCGNDVMNAIDTAFFWKNFATIVESFFVALISTALLKPSRSALFDKYPSTPTTSVASVNTLESTA